MPTGIARAMNRKINAYARYGPEILYHYTTLDGVKGILSSRKLWATHMRHLNDESEYQYAAKMAVAKLRDICSRMTHPVPIRELQDTIHRISQLQPRAFVFSLTEGGDLLSQWRAYGRFAIGFKGRHLNALARGLNRELNRVEYTPNNQIDQLDRLEAYAVRHSVPVARRSFPTVYSSRFIGLACFIKHPSFFEEREWRLLVQLQSGEKCRVKYRLGRTKRRIPYIEVPFATPDGPLPLAHIIVGPKTTAKECRYLDDFLNKHNLNVPVEKSVCPLR